MTTMTIWTIDKAFAPPLQSGGAVLRIGFLKNFFAR